MTKFRVSPQKTFEVLHKVDLIKGTDKQSLVIERRALALDHFETDGPIAVLIVPINMHVYCEKLGCLA